MPGSRTGSGAQFGRRELVWPGGTFRGFVVPAGTSIRAAFAYRLRDGRVVELWAIRDDLAMFEQLGAEPAVSREPTAGPDR